MLQRVVVHVTPGSGEREDEVMFMSSYALSHSTYLGTLTEICGSEKRQNVGCQIFR